MSIPYKRNTFDGKSDNIEQVLDSKLKEDFGKILDTLLVDNSVYEPEDTYDAIYNYLTKYEKLNVIYYAAITNIIYYSDNKYIRDLFSNLEKCLFFISNKSQSSKDTENENLITKIYRFFIKISEHISLAEGQVTKILQLATDETVKNMKNVVDDFDQKMKEQSSRAMDRINDAVSVMDNKIEKKSNDAIDRIEKAVTTMNRKLERRSIQDKKEMKKYYKGLEKDSITILGIFVAIILAFMGSIIIPSNIISNAANIGTAKLILLMSGVSFIFINILYLLIKFIAIINEKEEGLKKLIPLCKINIVLFIVFVLSLLGVFYTKDFEESQKNVSDNATKLSIELQK